MYEYRVTKYDPRLRDSSGAFTRPDWTSISDIGKKIGGRLVTESEYKRIESSYVDSAVEFLREAGITALTVRGFENHRAYPTMVSEGAELSLHDLPTAFQDVLREKYWCRFEQEDKAFVHFGFDYYMYIGTMVLCNSAIQNALKRGLFVEEYPSPCHPESDG